MTAFLKTVGLAKIGTNPWEGHHHEHIAPLLARRHEQLFAHNRVGHNDYDGAFFLLAWFLNKNEYREAWPSAKEQARYSPQCAISFIVWVTGAVFLACAVVSSLLWRIPAPEWRFIAIGIQVFPIIASILGAFAWATKEYEWHDDFVRNDRFRDIAANIIGIWLGLSVMVILFWTARVYLPWAWTWQQIQQLPLVFKAIIATIVVMLILGQIAANRQRKDFDKAKEKWEKQNSSKDEKLNVMKETLDAINQEERAKGIGLHVSMLKEIQWLQCIFPAADGTLTTMRLQEFLNLNYHPKDMPKGWLVQKGEFIVGAHSIYGWTASRYYEKSFFIKDQWGDTIRVDRDTEEGNILVALHIMTTYRTVREYAGECRTVAINRVFRVNRKDRNAFYNLLARARRMSEMPIVEYAKQFEATDHPASELD